MREFLKGLDFDKELIDTIMAEHGKYITGLKEQVDELKTDINSLTEELEENKNVIDELNTSISEKDESLKNLENITNENNDLQMQLRMRDSNVKKEFLKFVTSEIKGNMGEEDNFEDVLNHYKEENPQYFGETVVKKTQTSPDLLSENVPTSTNDIMNNIIRGRQ